MYQSKAFWSLWLVLVLNLVGFSNAYANSHTPHATYIGNYMDRGKPALIIQFDNTITSTNVADIYRVHTDEDEQKNNGKETKLKGDWVFNKAQNAVIYRDVKVNQVYRVKLHANIKSDDLNERTVTIAERAPEVRLIGRGPVVPSKGSRTVPLSVVNATQLSVEVLKVEQLPSILDKFYYNQNISTWHLQHLRKNYRTVTTLSYDLPKASVNQDVSTAIQLPKELADGWYILAIKVTGDFGYDNYVIGQVLLTDMGIQAKVFADHLAIQLNSFSNSKLDGTSQIKVYRQHKSVTLGDMTGLQKTFDYKVHNGDILYVQNGKQVSVLPLKEIPLDLSDFAVTGRDYQSTEAFAYSNRNLFKPGETLPLNVVLRDKDGQSLPKQRLFVEYHKPNSKVALSHWMEPTNNNAGFYQDHFAIPSGAPLGQWIAEIKTTADAKKPLTRFAFDVSEFVPERMDLHVTLPKGQIHTGVETLPVSVEGKYLFGAPANGNKLNITPAYIPQRHFPGNYHDFIVGTTFKIQSWNDVPEVDPIELDEQGHSTFDLPLIKQSLLKSPVLASYSFALQETGGASVIRNQHFTLWNGKSIAALRPAKKEFDSYEKAHFDIGLLDGQGQSMIAGKVQYLLERNHGGYYWIYNQSSGWDLRHDSHWQPVSSDILNITNGKYQGIDFNVDWGDYRLTLTAPSGVTTQYRFWAGWSEEKQGQRPVKPDQLTVSLDKKAYKNDEQATVTINSDVAGQLSLALEADNTIWTHQATIQKGSHQYHVPLTGLQRHDLYLTATLVGNENGMPRRLFAIKPLQLDREDRRLHVTINHPEKLLPLTGADIVVQLDKPTQEPTWVTVSMVDRGIINLARYKVPNIHRWFFGQRRYSADILDLYSRIYQQRPDSFLTHRYGGDTALAANRNPDQSVESKTITFMSQLVQFDSQGQATIHVEVPDYNGQAQIVAMAFNHNQYGQAQSDVIIASPVVAELAVPRFLAPGDNSQTLLEVFNTSDDTQTVTATVSASENLNLVSAHQLNVTLKPGERRSLAVPFSIGEIHGATGTAKLNLAVNASSKSGKTVTQNRSWSIPVREARPILTNSTSLTIGTELNNHSVTINDSLWRNIDTSDITQTQVYFSSSPQISYLNYVDGLFRYPYGCAEQTTSKAVPWLLKDTSLNSLKQQVENGIRDRAMIEKALLRLNTMQKGNGGFSLWDKYGEEWPWVTVYVTEFMLNVNQRFPGLVSDEMLTPALQRIQSYPTNKDLTTTSYYAAWVLARAKRSDISNLYSLYRRLDKESLPTSASAAYLGGAFLLAGDRQKADELFAQIPNTSRRYFWDDYDFGSQLRDDADALNVLLELNKELKLSNELLALKNRLIESVIHQAEKRSYLSTQEQSSLVKAGLNLKQEAQAPVTISTSHAGTTTEHSAKGTGAIQVKPFTTITNQDNKPIYLQINTSGRANKQSLHSTMEVIATRQFLTKDGQPYDGTPLKIGDQLIVELKLVMKEPVHQAMIVDYLPTGFVLDNPAFTNANDLLKSVVKQNPTKPDMVEYRNDRFVLATTLDWNDWSEERNTYRFYYVMRAETPGVSHVPAMYAENMYQPETYLYQPQQTHSSLVIQKP
ncbi:alpha-2-macroglobulin family protein [Vibrio nitrifigilis]|uniref:Alpha-2-macroglobulin family protein n=1 Tax=Vibrio nitrifigilis TaxID=2789781 RepID=A0ABS0GMB5_9VIBR|nr:MG2 domain-containing protein [Vibrio nitrifigilis]MBF9003588.1 hypothetical protein [Vibrio nitrifigilis]